MSILVFRSPVLSSRAFSAHFLRAQFFRVQPLEALLLDILDSFASHLHFTITELHPLSFEHYPVVRFPLKGCAGNGLMFRCLCPRHSMHVLPVIP